MSETIEDNKIEEKTFEILDENKDGVLTADEAVIEDKPTKAKKTEPVPAKAPEVKKELKAKKPAAKKATKAKDATTDHADELQRVAKARRAGRASSDVNRWRRRGRR